jgi:diguanylate cyclase (GGDEF)-like protein/PAS domain S-box-containing protein
MSAYMAMAARDGCQAVQADNNKIKYSLLGRPMAEELVPHVPQAGKTLRLPRTTISKTIATAFLIILLAATGNVLVVHHMLADVNGVAETVNVAGKLRMLSQKIAFEVTKVLHQRDQDKGAISANLNDFDTALMALARGGKAFGYDVKPLSVHHQALFDAAHADWVTYRNHVEEALLKASQGGDFRVEFGRITADAASLLSSSDKLVNSLTGEAQHAQKRALMEMYALLLLDAVILAIVFVTVRRQIVFPLRELAQHSRELADGNYMARIESPSLDEIGLLAESFNESAQRIGNLIARIDHDRQNLKQAEAMFRGFAENSVVGVYIAQDGRFRFVNPKMAEMFAYSQKEMISSISVYDLVSEHDRFTVEENIRKRLTGESKEVHYERQARRKDGSLFDVEVYGSLMKIDGEPATIGIMLDISERKRLDLALRVLSACNQALVRASDEAALLHEVCRSIHEISGYPFVWVGYVEEGAGKKVYPAALAEAHKGALMAAINHVSWDDSQTGRGATGTAIRRGNVVVVRDIQTSSLHAPWREFMVSHAIVSAMSLPLKTGDKILGALTVYSHEQDTFRPDEVQVAEELADNLAYGIMALRAEKARRKYAQQLEYHAGHDILTGLPNRALLQDRLSQAIAYAARYCYPIWVLFIDLDRFKFVNDSLGHNAGDTVLNAIATRLQFAVRETDTVARMGGDEFLVVLPERDDECLTTAVVQRIMDAVAKPLKVDGHEFVLGCSIGVAAYPNDGNDPETLIRNADIAMYRAKETGRNNFQFYTATMNERLLERLRIEGDLRNAIERQEFVLHYQPQVDLSSGRTIGAEVLIRWQHPTLGMVMPLRFISLAEETGMIVQIGSWVLRTACAQAKTWHDAGFGDLRIAVNLSARQFMQHDLVQSIANILAETGLPADCLELELTESLVMTDIDRAIEILVSLKALGVHLSLDDFGTGYSSLSYLKRLPFDSLKIDQSFVRDITKEHDGEAIVASIISLAHNLKRHVIAEGVETRDQLNYLLRYGCNHMQGYYFSRPLPAEMLEAMLSQDRLMHPAWDAGPLA